MTRGPADVGVVPSGGGINAVLLELGFLERIREGALWERGELDLRNVRRSASRDYGRSSSTAIA
ncbi:MAG: hypothetical protein E6G28_03480 [Actinobacteria bacterium]|nr:MAG: hypothetical protein E6G28_03480 [Actinomycetota bacterium]